MKTSGITAALPAQDVGRAKAFYIDKVGLHAVESANTASTRGQPNGWRWRQPAFRLSRPSEVVGRVHASRHSGLRSARCGRRDEGSRR